MNNVIKGPVSSFYAFVLMFIMVAPTDAELLIKFMACLFVICIWVIYLLGSSSWDRNPSTIDSEFEGPSQLYVLPRFWILPLLLIQFFMASYVGHYYTGMNALDVLMNVARGTSNYSVYQAYFRDSGLSTFSFSKIPAIFSYFGVKFIFVLFVFLFLVRSNDKKSLVLVFISALPVAIIGVYRGTNIEFFEIFVLVICGVYIKRRGSQRYNLPVIKMLLASLVFVSIYSLQLNFRYEHGYAPSCLNEFCYNENSIVYKIFPALYSLSAYFYFGPDYMARWAYFLSDHYSLLHFFLPGNGFLFGYEGKWLCGDHIKCGPTWPTDFELMIYNFGILGTFLLIFGLSFSYRKLKLRAHMKFVDFLGFYIVVLQLIALPVGNFLFISSANQLMLVSFLILFLLRSFSASAK